MDFFFTFSMCASGSMNGFVNDVLVVADVFNIATVVVVVVVVAATITDLKVLQTNKVLFSKNLTQKMFLKTILKNIKS